MKCPFRFKKVIIRGTWVAPSLSICLRVHSWYRGPGTEPCVVLPAPQEACFSHYSFSGGSKSRRMWRPINQRKIDQVNWSWWIEWGDHGKMATGFSNMEVTGVSTRAICMGRVGVTWLERDHEITINKLHSGVVHSSQKVEITSVSIDRWIDKQSVVSNAMEYYPALKRKEILAHLGGSMG